MHCIKVLEERLTSSITLCLCMQSDEAKVKYQAMHLDKASMGEVGSVPAGTDVWG